MHDSNRGQDESVAVPIADLMTEGLQVYGAESAKIGVVRRYDLDAGYMVVEAGVLARRELYVPFHLIGSITPHEIYLTVSKDELTDAYILPPAARPLVEEQTDAGTGRTTVVIEHEMRSGYDGRPVEVAPVPLDELTRTLAVGMTVTDADDEYVGEVTHIDPARGTLAVKGTLVDEAVRHVPFGQVARVDADDMCVTLLVPKASL
jgi:hypothetical protein